MSLVFDFQIDRTDSRMLLLGTEVVLFLYWSKLHYTKDNPSVTIILPFETNPYPMNILYYTVGWILQRLSKVKTEKASSKHLFLEFSNSNAMTLEGSEKAGLPTSTVEYRQLVKLFCPSERFVNFIQVIEANFVESMTIEMMITYDDGSLIEVVCSSLKKNNGIYNQCKSLFDDINDYSAQIVKDIFVFIFLRFKRMRGRWFINSMGAEHGGKSKRVDGFSTCGLVIAQSQISKERAAISSAILKESTTSTSTSTSTATINQNNNFAPSEDSYISTSSEDDNMSTSSKDDYSNSYADESRLHDSDIELENYFYTNENLE